jgi:hypothetical protein
VETLRRLQQSTRVAAVIQLLDVDQQNRAGVTSRLQCAGINRHEAEDERASRERSSDPLGLESCAGYREVVSEA